VPTNLAGAYFPTLLRPAETEAAIPMNASNVMITKVHETDSRRAILDRRGKKSDEAGMDRVD